MNIAIFADKYVGNECLKFVLENYIEQVKCIAFVDQSSNLHSVVNEYSFNKNNIIYGKDLNDANTIAYLKELQLDYIILAWWPNIIEKVIIDIPQYGVINFHPSLLPYCRGKNPNFWSIVEEVPYGVTLHFINEGIDTGDILFQNQIQIKWEDTGKTLYEKALKNIIQLFKDSYPKIIEGNYQAKKQYLGDGTFHYGKELDSKCEIKLEKYYKGKELLNLLRARTFKPYQGCYFYDNGKKYEVTVSINEIEIENKNNEER